MLHFCTGLPGVLSDHDIKMRMLLPASDPNRLVINPFLDHGQCLPDHISYGLSSSGYDLILGHNFKSYGRSHHSRFPCAEQHIDPLDVEECLVTHQQHHAPFLLEANGFILGETVEWIEMPRDCIGVIFGKSRLARVGLCLNMTIAEPGWKGKLTLEIANLTHLPIKLYPGHGIGQIVFLRSASACLLAYGEKPKPSYQNQQGVTLPRRNNRV